MAYSDDRKPGPKLRPNKPPYGRPTNPKKQFDVAPRRKAEPDKEELMNNNRNTELEGDGMRLNKFIAHCGICSRRQAADYVKEGFVTVNDQKVIEPFLLIKAICSFVLL